PGRSDQLTAEAPRAPAEGNTLFAGLEDEGPTVRPPLDRRGKRGSPVGLIAAVAGGVVTLVVIAVVALIAFRGSPPEPPAPVVKGPNPPPIQPGPNPVPKQVNPGVEQPNPQPPN